MNTHVSIAADTCASVVLQARLGYTDIPACEHKGILNVGTLDRVIRFLVHKKQDGYLGLTIFAQDKVDFFEYAVLEGPVCSVHQLPGDGTCTFTGVSSEGFFMFMISK
jgi:hypothetical protein